MNLEQHEEGVSVITAAKTPLGDCGLAIADCGLAKTD